MVTAKKKSRRGVSPLRKANEIDAMVGKRLRLRRVMLGISQDELARRLGLTFQQVQKYELGTNRISASRLYQLAEILDTTVAWFFDNLGASDMPDHNEAPEAVPDAFSRRETLELVRTYYEIGDPAMRRQLYRMARLLAGKTESD